MDLFGAKNRMATGNVIARQACVVAGTEVAAEVLHRVDESLRLEIISPDSSRLSPGDTILRIHGNAGSLLTAERTMLNFLQRLSGVATLTRQFVDAVAGTGVAILDTRKTTPGFRALEKAAVLAGGGSNHRMGLHDRVMIKDNHLAVGTHIADLQDGIDLAHQRGLPVEIEVDTLDQLSQVLQLRHIDYVLLDNMTPDTLRQAVQLNRGRVHLEASGGITLHSVRQIAETGVDSISIGALTHSAPSVDIGLDFTNLPTQ